MLISIIANLTVSAPALAGLLAAALPTAATSDEMPAWLVPLIAAVVVIMLVVAILASRRSKKAAEIDIPKAETAKHASSGSPDARENSALPR